MFYGGTPLPDVPDVILDGAPGDSLGFSISAAGDFDHDGRDDLIRGGATYSQSGLKRAARPDTTTGAEPWASAPDLVLLGEVAGDHFGWSVTDCGRFTGENADCVAVGAPLNGSHSGLESGAA